MASDSPGGVERNSISSRYCCRGGGVEPPRFTLAGFTSIPIVMGPILKTEWHRPRRVAAAVSDIEINAIATARHRTSVCAVSACSLVLGRDHPIRIASAVDIDIIAIPAILHLLH